VKWTGESSIKVIADRADFFVAFVLAGIIDNIIRPFICAVTKKWMNKKDTFCVGDCFCDWPMFVLNGRSPCRKLQKEGSWSVRSLSD